MFLFQLHYKAIMCEVTSMYPQRPKMSIIELLFSLLNSTHSQQGISSEKINFFSPFVRARRRKEMEIAILRPERISCCFLA